MPRVLYGAIEAYLTPLRLLVMGMPSGLIMVLAIFPHTRAILVLVYLLNNSVVRWSRTRDLAPELRRFHKAYRKVSMRRRRRSVRTLLIVLAIILIVVLALALIGAIWHVPSPLYGPMLPAWPGAGSSPGVGGGIPLPRPAA